MRPTSLYILPIFLVLTSAAAYSKSSPVVKLDAYYSLEVNGKHVGFSVERDEYDPQTGNHKFEYFLKTNEEDNDMEQFVSTTQSEKYRPLSFKFLSKVRDAKTSIHGQVHDKDLILKIKSAGGTKKASLPLGENTFFSSALGPLVIASHPEKGKVLSFQAISEEEGSIGDGEIYVIDQTKVGQHTIYRLITRFQNVESEVWLLDTGVALATQSTHLKVRSSLVDDRAKAIEGLDFDLHKLTKFFGVVPSGKINPFSQKEFSLPSKPLFTSRPTTKSLEGKGKLPIKISK